MVVCSATVICRANEMEFPYPSFFVGTQVFAEGFPVPQFNRDHGLQPFEGCLPVVPDQFVEGVLD